jgi:hypothetical protein
VTFPKHEGGQTIVGAVNTGKSRQGGEGMAGSTEVTEVWCQEPQGIAVPLPGNAQGQASRRTQHRSTFMPGTAETKRSPTRQVTSPVAQLLPNKSGEPKQSIDVRDGRRRTGR